MPRLIDADALLDKLKIRDLPIRLTWEIQTAPTIDAAPVVRCRECKNWNTDWEPNYFNPDNPMYYCAETDLFLSGDWYCADGQRREDGDA